MKQSQLSLNNFNMIDEEKQSTFAGSLLQHDLALRMRKGTLEIQVVDKDNFDQFFASIDQEFIERQDRYFKGHFDSPQDIFDHLTQKDSEIVVQKEVFKFSYISGQRQQVREGIVQLEKKITDDTTIASLKIAKIKEHFTVQLQQRDKRIATLQEGLQELSEQLGAYIRGKQQKRKTIRIKRINKRLEAKDKIYKGLQERLLKEEQCNKDLKERLEKEERCIKGLEERLQKEEQTSKSLEERMRQIEKTSNREIAISHQDIGHHPDNSHEQFYDLKYFSNLAKLVRIGGGNSWYNFINKSEVLPKQNNKYRVRVVKAVDSQLMIGFSSIKGLGNIYNYNSAESVYYYCWGNGFIYDGGVRKQLSRCGSVTGQLLECVADILQGKIRWIKAGKLFAQCFLPAAMKGKPVYFSVLLYSEGDSVDISPIRN